LEVNPGGGDLTIRRGWKNGDRIRKGAAVQARAVAANWERRTRCPVGKGYKKAVKLKRVCREFEIRWKIGIVLSSWGKFSVLSKEIARV
jgi:hypothetical protein